MTADFNKRFNRNVRIVRGGSIAVFVLIIAIIVGSIIGTIALVKGISEHGLKYYVEQIWEGPKK
jgi:hypothetical protein